MIQDGMIHDGIIDLAPGKIAAIVTYLEMARPLQTSQPQARDNAFGTFAAIGTDLDRFRRLFRSIGEPWLWFSRLSVDDAALTEILGDPGVESLALVRDGRDIGLLELDFREAGACEVAFLGLVPDAVGRGTGRFMIETAMARAVTMGASRLWLHTCTFDHPGALGFYRRMGFSPTKFAVEVLDDPRLTGLMPREAAPHVPLIAG